MYVKPFLLQLYSTAFLPPFLPRPLSHVTDYLLYFCTVFRYRRSLIWINQTPESGIGGVGNKRVTSKRGYQYQRLDGGTCIFCRWQGCHHSRQSHDLPCGRNQLQDGYFNLKWPVRTSMAEAMFVCIIYRWTPVLLCCVSFISFVEPLLLCV